MCSSSTVLTKKRVAVYNREAKKRPTFYLGLKTLILPETTVSRQSDNACSIHHKFIGVSDAVKQNPLVSRNREMQLDTKTNILFDGRVRRDRPTADESAEAMSAAFVIAIRDSEYVF
ncbi:hypothetical protein EVAR_9636_1 [Eumeta japonica]|uniref:Uncharacterized protein n=1 Tax=Eumeta variegata TaxID=151549 RepID=A0A4C1TL07_EUMVA|nr:hypothetical protein EVAR_9636_1 [Eumeta japonica]